MLLQLRLHVRLLKCGAGAEGAGEAALLKAFWPELSDNRNLL